MNTCKRFLLTDGATVVGCSSTCMIVIDLVESYRYVWVARVQDPPHALLVIGNSWVATL